MAWFSWLSILGQLRKTLSVAFIFGIDLAQPHMECPTLILKKPSWEPLDGLNRYGNENQKETIGHTQHLHGATRKVKQ